MSVPADSASETQDTTGPRDIEPRWPVVISLLASAGLYYALPDWLSIGPNWLLPALVLVLIALTLGTLRATEPHAMRLHQYGGFITSTVLTVGLIWALGQLIFALPGHRESAKHLLVSAAALWVSNVLVFAQWYWRLDAGGPFARDRRRATGHDNGSFLFPQMTRDDVVWTPEFVDYLFLAFNTSSALSPTDTAVLSRWAKILMMIQSLISLMVLGLLSARAVNIL